MMAIVATSLVLLRPEFLDEGVWRVTLERSGARFDALDGVRARGLGSQGFPDGWVMGLWFVGCVGK